MKIARWNSFVKPAYYNLKAFTGDNWPRYQHDNLSSGISPDKREFPLSISWVYTPQRAPNPAWPAPAKE